MDDYKREFIEFMVESDVLRFGDFTLKSGRKSPFFMNAGAYVTGEQLHRLGLYYARAIEARFGLDFEDVTTSGKSIDETHPILMAQGVIEVVGLIVSMDRQEVGKGGTVSALAEVSQRYGIATGSIVTMSEVVECLYNRPCQGRVIIDDACKQAIDAYYRQYGAR